MIVDVLRDIKTGGPDGRPRPEILYGQRKTRTTVPAKNGSVLLNRQFRAAAPNQAWVTDFYVAT